ncbi:MAG: hypothetical protein COV98_00095 [Candidatus Altarchaeum sp. CG12_big_fil_rev_8_21_14_0_65_33_22]|uniref:Rhomboid family intramembrane serine protease n=1 Tax=Candidatus Altarchaeum hamiconexum TaxID=1803513 RepID=A0A8J7YWK1_9ARCH|nr:rhomboid family intramembrane serine protease [Candidatus Altarchaeum hamiconexum]OIQ05157.1 MAG: hypothetical protein AUK59_04995 [Candidatus Altarchaeum sp. CG2_30_32_3053]PIN68185.1 MAG: hypothetical protein COV98_00095 [Candidatus Altarchaeum sp. CG12_big_fil_rev_8_21_14_0_65_33_22]PIV27528.1 MAG: hypothetical protein COS36_05350 [Candidatus Altarchaeum sp. CG03_land_8_20_14_0_80_32_618]PIX48800.1 MAG: hypothetical protein COZ53_02845 [Candidatus Altarchaeum sp. CG_4_8_14_3_um_filter_33_
MVKVYEALIAANVVLFVLGAIINFNAAVALIPAAVLQGEIWRLFTSMFLHGGFGHIIMNMLALYFFGMILEPMIGSRKFLIVYITGGIVGGLCVMIFSFFPLSIIPGLGINPYSIVIGASGAIFAIGTILALFAPNLRVGFLFFPIQTTLFYSIILWFVVLTLISLFGAPIANSAHLGGIVAGMIMVKFLIKHAREEDFY